MAGPVEKRRGQGDPAGRRFWGVSHPPDPSPLFPQGRRPRKKRSQVAVFPQAQKDDVGSALFPKKQPQTPFKDPGIRFQICGPRKKGENIFFRKGYAAQEKRPGRTAIAFRMVQRHETFVPPQHPHPPPGDSFRPGRAAQPAVKPRRSAPPGQHQSGPGSDTQALAEEVRHPLRRGFRQRGRRRERSPPDFCQFSISVEPAMARGFQEAIGGPQPPEA